MPPTRLDLSYQRQQRAVRDRVERFVRQRFTAGQFRDDDVARFVAEVVPVVLAGRRQVSALTDAWLATRLSASLGRRVRPRGPIDTDALRGVPADEVYQRPFVSVRTKLSEGMAFDAAVSVGLERATDIVTADMQLAKTHTVRAVFSGTPGVTGYRRTLTGSKNCGLCAVASTQRYSRGDLLPIHPGCDCGVEEITEGSDFVPGEDLDAVHEAMQERFGVSDRGARAIDYRKALLVREHGELGPVLTVAEHRFTGKHAI